MSFDVEQVVARGLCVGCGGCSVRTSGAIPVTIGRRGVYEADVSGATPAQLAAASRVCPFSDAAKNEDQLATERFDHLPVDSQIGRYQDTFAGRLTDESRIVGSSSGGLTSLILEELLRQDDVDGIIHVGRSDGDAMFGYRISHTIEEVVEERKSFYYATTLAEVLSTVREQPGRYAIVGVPCFIKAARLLASDDSELGDRLAYFVGILCGHLKSQFYAESLGWQTGVQPADLTEVDFRVKNPDRPSNRYDYTATSHSGETRTKSMSSTIDGSWGYGAFQPESCNFCDDVFAETADVVLGDAWLPEYRADWRGTNVVVTRNEHIAEILYRARAEGRITLDHLTPDRAAETQAGNYRHRRQGQSVRLADDIAAGLTVPVKRVSPGYPVPAKRVRLIRHRREMSRLSLETFAAARESGNLADYLVPMRAAIAKYKRLDAASKGPVAFLKYALKTTVKKVLRRR